GAGGSVRRARPGADIVDGAQHPQPCGAGERAGATGPGVAVVAGVRSYDQPGRRTVARADMRSMSGCRTAALLCGASFAAKTRVMVPRPARAARSRSTSWRSFA